MSGDRRDSGSGRPYSKLSVAQLEGVIASARSDGDVLQRLDRELRFRETERAVRLRQRVGKALAANADTPAPALPTDCAEPSPGRAPAKARPAKPRTRPDIAIPTGDRAAPKNEPSRSTAIPRDANASGAVLAAWTALEALSPQTYRRPEDMAAGDRSCVADLTAVELPWKAGEHPRKNHRLYYQIILGAIPMAKASERLIAAFGEDEERKLRLREKAAIAAILVDRNGMLIEESGISVSSFAWAMPLALQLKLDGLGAWPEVEPAIIEHLDGLLRRRDKNGNALPLDRATIDKAHDWLMQEFGVQGELIEPPSFAVRIHQANKIKHAPQAALLNSFFLSDLARGAALVKQGKAPTGLRRYLGLEPPRETVDLLADDDALEQAIAPAMMPLTRWPHPGGHSLVMLQQAAINLARSELAGGDGMITVNGPPGTGKTTLLRDLVSAAVLDRAVAMAAFDDPDKAFTASSEKVSVGEKGFFQLYTLAPSLKGHEIVVASSNNKAVENISRELPAASAVGRTAEEIGYFRSVGASLQGVPDAVEREDDSSSLAPEPIETWGMIAAVLGNRKNLASFQKAFWWGNERSFRLYLKAAKGDDVRRDIRDPETGAVIGQRAPHVVDAEHPPLPDTASAAWRDARDRLLTLKQAVETELQALEGVRRLSLDLTTVRRDLAGAESAIERLMAARREAGSHLTQCSNQRQATIREDKKRLAAVAESRKSRPGLFAWVLRTERWTSWARAHAPLVAAASLAAHRRTAAELGEKRAGAVLEGLTADLLRTEARHAQLKVLETQRAKDLDRHRPALGDRLVDDHLFARGHEASHMASPWLPDSLQRKREDLFIAALAVHRAFIDAAARKVYHNLGALMDVFANGPPQDEAKRKLLGDLWSTLHMTVPVVSTTFASADRMLGALPPGSIGWLLIDEAGQAHPQAAVGAIARARRTVVVGDPLQLQPVVIIPERLNADICKHFKIDPKLWSAPNASAQTVADRASRFQAAFRSADGSRRVGIPLLVHRRCQEPMFGMFNRIAYDRQMVQAVVPRGDNAIGNALGASRWFDVDGAADMKWCPAEGEAVVGLLKRMAVAGVKKPDLFIVTPFRIVAQELRRRLETERALFATLELDPLAWINNNVGIVHTVQGREADAVVLILGAPKPAQSRARIWAAETPNVFNVALSRARQSFYVVGSRDAWSDVGHGQELASLPTERIAMDGDSLNVIKPELPPLDDARPKKQLLQNRHGPSI